MNYKKGLRAAIALILVIQLGLTSAVPSVFADSLSPASQSHAYNAYSSNEPEGLAYDWLEISESGTLVMDSSSGPLPSDLASNTEVALPFDFTFYGETFRSLYVNAAWGGVNFGSDPQSFSKYIDVGYNGSGAYTQGAVYSHFDEINNRFVVEFKDMKVDENSAPATFEAIIYPDGRILVQHKTAATNTWVDVACSAPDICDDVTMGNGEEGVIEDIAESSTFLFSLNKYFPIVSINQGQVETYVGARKTLSATGYTLNGDVIDYDWTIRSIPSTSTLVEEGIVALGSGNVYFVPDVPGTYSFELRATNTNVGHPDYTIKTVDIAVKQDISGGYVLRDASTEQKAVYKWKELNDPNNPIGTRIETYSAQSIGFDFPFFSKTYSSFFIQSGGKIYFDENDYGSNYIRFFGRSLSQNSDLGGYFYYYDEENQSVIIEADGMEYYDSTSRNYVPFSAQIVLTNKGNIYLYYKTVTQNTFKPSAVSEFSVDVGDIIRIQSNASPEEGAAFAFIKNLHGVELSLEEQKNASVNETTSTEGIGSTISSDPINYQWNIVSLPEGSSVSSETLSGATQSQMSFTPDRLGDYVFSLRAQNATFGYEDETATKQVTVHVYGASYYSDESYSTLVPNVSEMMGNTYILLTHPNFTYVQDTLTGVLTTEYSHDSEDIVFQKSGNSYRYGPISIAHGSGSNVNNGVLELGENERISLQYLTPRKMTIDLTSQQLSDYSQSGAYVGSSIFQSTSSFGSGDLLNTTGIAYASKDYLVFGAREGEKEGFYAFSYNAAEPVASMRKVGYDFQIPSVDNSRYDAHSDTLYYKRNINGIDSVSAFAFASGSILENKVLFDDTYSMNYGETLMVAAPGVLGNDLAVNSGALSATIVDEPKYGTATLNPDGSFSYVAYPSEVPKDDVFSYIPSEDGIYGQVTQVKILVNNKPKRIIAQDKYMSLMKNSSSWGYLSYNFSSSDDSNSPIVVTVTSPTQHGSISWNEYNKTEFHYTPDPDYSGPDSFSFKISKGDLQDSEVKTVYILVAEKNSSGTQQIDYYSMGSGSTVLSITSTGAGLLANDTSSNGRDSLKAFLIKKPQYGDVTVNQDGTFEYTRTNASNMVRFDSFEYVTFDGDRYYEGNNAGKAMIHFETSYDAYYPIAKNGSAKVDLYTFGDHTILTQPEHADPLSVQWDGWTGHEKTYVYTPRDEEFLNDSFKYRTEYYGAWRDYGWNYTGNYTAHVQVSDSPRPESFVQQIHSMTMLRKAGTITTDGIGAVVGGANREAYIFDNIAAGKHPTLMKKIARREGDPDFVAVYTKENSDLLLLGARYDGDRDMTIATTYSFSPEVLTTGNKIITIENSIATQTYEIPGSVSYTTFSDKAQILSGKLWIPSYNNGGLTSLDLESGVVFGYSVGYGYIDYFVNKEGSRVYTLVDATSSEGGKTTSMCHAEIGKNEWTCVDMDSQLVGKKLGGLITTQSSVLSHAFRREENVVYFSTREHVFFYEFSNDEYDYYIKPVRVSSASSIGSDYPVASMAAEKVGADDSEYLVTHPDIVLQDNQEWSGWNHQVFRLSLSGSLHEGETVDIGWKGYNTRGECGMGGGGFGLLDTAKLFLVPTANAWEGGMGGCAGFDYNDIYLEVYNHLTEQWDLADYRMGNDQFNDFTLHKTYTSAEIAPYVQGGEITYRVKEYEYMGRYSAPASLYTNYVYLNQTTNTNLVTSFFGATGPTPTVNHAPVLDSIGNRTVAEDGVLSFTATATDSDTPAQNLTYSLDPSAVTGATINPTTGVFSWTPTEAQGPGVYNITITVTDNGTPNLSDSEIIQVTVTESNLAPMLDAIADQTIEVNNLLTFATHATDLDIPVNTLTFSLSGAPLGATIDPSTGVFSWTPDGSQGPATYSGVSVRVTDNGSPALFDEKTFTINVTNTPPPPTNLAPILASIGNKLVNEGEALSFTASATDADIPAQTLVYSLDSGAPAGATIDPVTGVFTWTPTEAQGPGTYNITVRVTDNGTPVLDDFETIQVAVNEVNVAPVLDPISNQIVEINTLISVPTHASDIDIPTQSISYSLDSTGHTGATIDPSTGMFSWTPSVAGGTGTFTVVVRATDNGTPALFATGSFTITVNKTPDPVNGACGSDNLQTLTNAPVNLCTAGSGSAVTFSGSTWSWSCNGAFSGTDASCSATKAPDPVNGVCGTSNGATFASQPSTNLCISGGASSVTGAGPWSWTCNGQNGGNTISCSAAKQSAGGGGGSAPTPKDNCPAGDYSPSYYDGKCGTPPKPVTQTGITVQDLSYTGSMNQTITGVLLGSTASGTVLSYQSYIVSSTGTLKTSTGGAFQYIPEMNYLGTYSFKYRATDGKNWSNTGTVSINYVNPGSGAPASPKKETPSAGGGGPLNSAPSTPTTQVWPENVYIKNMCNYSDLDYGQIEFTDIQGNPHEKQITILLRNCIVNGVDYVRFAPAEHTTRAEALKMILRSTGAPYDFFSTQTVFSDIPSPSWQVGLVQKGYEMDVIQGEPCGDGKMCFRPNDYISMQELLKILMRTLGLVDKNKQFANSTEEFDFYVKEAKKLNLFSNISNIETVTKADYIPTRDEVSRVVVNAFEKKYQIGIDK